MYMKAGYHPTPPPSKKDYPHIHKAPRTTVSRSRVSTALFQPYYVCECDCLTVYILKNCPNNPIAIVLATVHLGRISGSLPDRLMKPPAGGTIGKPPKVGPAEGWVQTLVHLR